MAGDPNLRLARASDEPLGPTVPVKVIRHARADRVRASFIENVWSEVARCAACHSLETNTTPMDIGRYGTRLSEF